MNIVKSVAVCLLSLAPLSIAKISQSREQHQIDVVPESNGHGEFCESWIMENNTKRKGDIFRRDYRDNSFSMNIDGKTVKLYPVSSRKITKKREIKTYKGDRFRVKVDSIDVSTPKGLKNCGMDIDETITVSTDGWKKVMLLKVGCDPCG
jgi:hypothetical protein